jgi:hypothetical protein
MREVRPQGGLLFSSPSLFQGSPAVRTGKHTSCPFFIPFLLTACLLGGSGCGGSEKVISVKGKVTRNGKPVAGIMVSFVPQNATKTGVSTGETDDNGFYELTVFKTGSSGAVVGKHKVWVSLPREPPEPVDKEAKMKTKKKGTPATEKQPADLADILKKYGNPDKTPLIVEVKGGEPIDLKLD